jgi:hypothetical protein
MLSGVAALLLWPFELEFREQDMREKQMPKPP